MEVSIILPLFNEIGNLEKLFEEIIKNTKAVTKNFEVIFIDDGSTDGSDKVIKELFKKNPKTVKYIIFAKNYGKSAALDAGFKMAQGEIVITMDADGQDDPKEIARFAEKINEGFDLVSGWKQNRKDSFIKNNTSKIYNGVTNSIFKLSLHDHNCGFKAYKKEVIKNLSLYGELHRYIPALAADMGYKIGEIGVHHRKRFSGKTKFGTKRFVNGFLDLLTVFYLTTFKNRPLHLFGSVGIFLFGSGFLTCLYLTIIKLLGGQSIGDRPLLQLGIMLITVGIQVTLFGLLAEQMSVIKNNNKPSYRVRDTQS